MHFFILFFGNSETGVMSWIPTSSTSILVVGSSIVSFSYTVGDEDEVDGDIGKSLNDEHNAVVEEIKNLKNGKFQRSRKVILRVHKMDLRGAVECCESVEQYGFGSS